MYTNTLDRLDALVRPERVGRDGERHATCPFCGKEAKHGQVHFSYSERGYKCFVCGESGALAKLLDHYGVDRGGLVIEYVKPPNAIRPMPPWFGKDRKWWRSAYYHSDRAREIAVDQWQAYRPLSRELILNEMLAYGILPHPTRTVMPRLLLPVFDERGRLTCVRGRKVSLDDGEPKWMTPGGWSMEQLPLYGIDRVNDQSGQVWITESPVDTLLFRERWSGGVAVATMGATYWRDEWAEQLKERAPAAEYVIAFDNDAAGLAASARVANHMLRVGCRRVRMLNWAGWPEKADLSDMVLEGSLSGRV